MDLGTQLQREEHQHEGRVRSSALRMACSGPSVRCAALTITGLLHVTGVGALSSRVTVPFGGGWRFQLGDDPNGRGPGPGTLSDFKMVHNASCTGLERNPNMRRGKLAAGSEGGDCAVSCAYDPGCFVHQLAFTIPNARWQQCLHGGACSGRCLHSVRTVTRSWDDG